MFVCVCVFECVNFVRNNGGNVVVVVIFVVVVVLVVVVVYGVVLIFEILQNSFEGRRIDGYWVK